MGGNALKNLGVITDRVSTKVFNTYYDEISNIVRNKLDIDTYQVKSYHNKPTHGDLDILLKIDKVFHDKGINIFNWIKDSFDTKAIYNNGGVLSWEYNNFQIDFIPVKESNWNIAKHFFDYSPMGNLIGKTAHKFNLKFGFEGLQYSYRNFNGRMSHNINISKDPIKIFNFLGYDYERYLTGFSDEIDVFQYIINGKFFNGDLFQMDNLNRIDRKRNQKRPDYQRFIEYVNSADFIEKYYVFNKDKHTYLPHIDEYFPEANLLIKLKELSRKNDENEKLSKLFNGNVIMNIYPDLVGKELGNMMTEFKKSIGENWKAQFLSKTQEQILEQFHSFYVKHKIKNK